MKALAVLLALLAAPAHAQVQVEGAWARATAPGATVAGGYLVIRSAAADRLVGVSSPAAARVEMHVHIHEGGVMKMREVPGYDVPANGSFELRPGGAHLMFVEIRRPFKEGEKIPAKLRFEKAGEVSVEFNVGRLSEPAPAHRHPKH